MYVLFVFAALIFPIITVPFVLNDFGRTRKVLPTAFILALIMALICMGVENNGYGDLVTYAAEISKYEGLEFGDFSQTKYANYIGSSIVFWAIAQTGNPHLVQFFNGFVEYFILSYIVLDYSKRNAFSWKKTALTVVAVVTLVPLYSSISAIRSTPALDIGLLALYRDLYQNRRDILTVVLYLLPVTMHATGLSMLAIRIVVFIARKNGATCFAIGFLSLPVLIFSAVIISPFFDGFTVNPIELLLEYNAQSEIGWAATVSNSLFYQLFRALNLFFVIVLGIDIIVFLRRNSSCDHATAALYNGLLVGLGLIGSFCISVTDPAFMRYSYAIYPLVALYMTGRSNALDKADDEAETEKRKKETGLSSFRIRYLMYIVVCSLFFVAHCYLFYLGADPSQLIQTMLFGIFATPQLGTWL